MSSRIDVLPERPTAADRPRLPVPLQAKAADGPRASALSPSRIPWIFAAKTTASALLALLVAFTFNLDQPKWALLTVFIVAQPQSGLVLAKSFYRILGTIVGAAGALALVSLFAQERVLFLGSLALWIGVCTFASRNARNFASYGFVLSGYTVAIVGITGALNPDNAFFVAQARVTEISLGIIAAATISHLVLPLTLADSLWGSVAAARTAVAECAIAVLEGRDTAELRSRLLAQAIGIENLRASAVFEDDQVRARSDALRSLAAPMLSIADIAYLLSHSLAFLHRNGVVRPDLESAAERSTATVARWHRSEIGAMELQRDLTHASATLPLARSYLHSLSSSDEDVIRHMAIIGRVREFLTALVAFADAHEAVLLPAPDVRQSKRVYVANDWIGAAVAGVRAALALLVVGAFWILADWPSGTTATILAAVVTARLATMEQPQRAAMGGTMVVVLATLPAFVLVEVVLPLASGFAMFSLMVGPLLFLCAFLMAHKKTAGFGFVAALYIANTAAFQDRMAYDAVGFLNTSLAIALVLTTSSLLFATVLPETPAEAQRRFVRVARRLFRRIGSRVRPIRLSEFETAMTEALDQWRRNLQSDADKLPASIEGGVALLGIGRELIRVHDDRWAMPEKLHVTRHIARFLATEERWPLECARRTAGKAAVTRLHDLRIASFGALEARAASREMVAFAAIQDELERCGDLLLPESAKRTCHVA